MNGQMTLNEAVNAAAYSGHEAVVDLLIKRGASVKVRDERGWLALHIAAHAGQERVVRLLIEMEPSIKQREEIENRATPRRDRKRVRVRTKDRSESTALHLAAGNGHKAVVRLLVEKGAYIDSKDNSGWTALHCVVNYSKSECDPVARKIKEQSLKEIAQLLLENGASVEIKDKGGRKPRDYAIEKRPKGMVKLLDEYRKRRYRSTE
jgi:ankyrin repeat protein